MNTMSVDGSIAKIAYDADLDTFRGKIMGLPNWPPVSADSPSAPPECELPQLRVVKHAAGQAEDRDHRRCAARRCLRSTAGGTGWGRLGNVGAPSPYPPARRACGGMRGPAVDRQPTARARHPSIHPITAFPLASERQMRAAETGGQFGLLMRLRA